MASCILGLDKLPGPGMAFMPRNLKPLTITFTPPLHEPLSQKPRDPGMPSMSQSARRGETQNCDVCRSNLEALTSRAHRMEGS